MIILLVTINHYLAHSFQSDEDDIVELRHEVEDVKDVITDKSTFSSLVNVKNNHPVRKNDDDFNK